MQLSLGLLHFMANTSVSETGLASRVMYGLGAPRHAALFLFLKFDIPT